MVTSAMTLVGRANTKSRKEELDSLFARMKRAKKPLTSVASVREWFSGNGTSIDYDTARALWRRLVGRKAGASLFVTTADTALDVPESAAEQVEVAPPVQQDAPAVAMMYDPPPAVAAAAAEAEGPARHSVCHGA